MISRYYLDSLVPSWLAADPGYLAALGEHLADRMDLSGHRLVEGPCPVPVDAGLRLPVGITLVRVECAVEEFDIDMADDDPAPAGQWLVCESAPGRVHVAPLDDAVVHEFTETCVCMPTPVPVPTVGGTGWKFVHHSLDGREQHEAQVEE